MTYASWRWIFVLNLPLGLIALCVAMRIVPDLRPGREAGLDWLGFVLTGAGLGALVYGLELVTDGNVSWAAVGAGIGAGAVLIWWAVGHLRRATHPLLDLRVLRVSTFRAASLGGSLFRMAISAAPFLLALMFQDGFGWSPLRSGMLVIGVFVGNITIKPFTTAILHRFGFRTVLMTSAAAAGFTLALCASFTPGTPLVLIELVLVVSGVFRSIGFTAYNTIVFADVAPEGMGNANTLSSTIQQLTMGLGVAVGALALRAGAPLDRLVGAASTGGGPFARGFPAARCGGLLRSRGGRSACPSGRLGDRCRTARWRGRVTARQRRSASSTGLEQCHRLKPATVQPALCRVNWSRWLSCSTMEHT